MSIRKILNPFVTSGYVSEDYFCDRETEREQLLCEIKNGNNLALISVRRMGKTGLIRHCFNDKEIDKNYYTFFIDIYATKSLRDFVFLLGREIMEVLKPQGRKALERFWNAVKSLQTSISFDVSGNPSLNLGLGDIHSSEITLNEIFHYLNTSDKPCIVAIDEFQQIAGYTEKNIEALLRTHIQHCTNSRFIFAGSRRHTMGNIFLSPSRPFYQSVSMLNLEKIPLEKYVDFACCHFENEKKKITPKVVQVIYNQYDGVTWYMQKLLNVLFSNTKIGDVCTEDMIGDATKNIVDSYKYAYLETLFRLPEKQKELLVAIAKEKVGKELTSGAFVQKYKLGSTSSVQAALRGLLDKDFITNDMGQYQVYDQFFGIWLRENY